MDDVPSVVVSSAIIRMAFNQGGYWERLRQGQFRARVIRHRELVPTPDWLLPGTASQVIAYEDRHGAWVAIVHQYLQPNGTLGAGGLPDPKWLKVIIRTAA